MLAVRLPGQLEKRLSDLSALTERPKSYYVKQALEEYLSTHEEYFHAIARLEKRNPRLTLEEMEKRLGLED
jgi:RHH-type rel operon transcriptional repressor/antitoxin RelB